MYYIIKRSLITGYNFLAKFNMIYGTFCIKSCHGPWQILTMHVFLYKYHGNSIMLMIFYVLYHGCALTRSFPFVLQVLRSVASLFSLRLAALFPRYTCIIVYVGAIMVLGLLIILMFWIWGVAAGEGRRPMTGRRIRPSRSASRRVRCVFFIASNDSD